ncbi:MAG TPA: hypothetical protein VL068_06245, partial [Microthrixaceae bacterium]|nr:hypothetical protein [Microthrixaceae bacterium]
MSVSSIVRPSGRRAAFFAAIVLVATTLAVTGCVAPPTIGSGLRPAPPDAARDPLTNPAPSRGCATTVDALRTGRSTVKLSVGGTFRSALVDIPDA